MGRDLLRASASPSFSRATAALSRAVKLSERGDFESARQLSVEAASLFASAHSRAGELRADYEAVRALHLAQDSKNCLKTALSTARDLVNGQYPWISTQFQLEKGTCFWIAGDLGRTKEAYLAALKTAKKTMYKAVYFRALAHVSGLSSELGEEALAWKQAETGLSSSSSSSAMLMQSYNLYFVLHMVAAATNHCYLDVAVWREAVAISEKTPDVLLHAAAHAYLGRNAADIGMMELARDAFSDAAKEFQTAPQSHATRVAYAEAETRLAQVELRQGNENRAIARLTAIEPDVLSASDNLLALIFYRALGEALLKTNLPHEAEMATRAAIALSENNLASLRTESQRLLWGRESVAAYKMLIELKLQRGDSRNALELWEWYRGASLRSGETQSHRSSLTAAELKEDPPDFQPEAVERSLPSLRNETVLSYAVLDDGIEVWLYDNRGITAHWVQAPKDWISLAARKLRNLCSRPQSNLSELHATARSLYDLLIGPVAEQIAEGRVLVVETDDDLSFIPFEVLLDPAGHYLGERFSVVSSYGLHYADSLRLAQPLTPGTPSLLVGVPAPAGFGEEHLPVVADAQTEAEAAADRFQSPVLLLGPNATGDRLLQALPMVSIFHFAGHAVVSGEGTELLLFDTSLSAKMLERARLWKLDLAVLSACDTANGSEGTAIDTDSLVRSFERSGVPHVVASRWKLDSAAARRFMQVFYAAAFQGNSISRCLQLSQNAIRNSDGMSHPYYWAALQDFGRS